MKKYLTIISFLLLFFTPAMARHIKGGEVFYEYLGPGAGNNDKFKVTVRLFIDCNSTAQQVDNEINVAIYRNSDNRLYNGTAYTFPKTYDNSIRLTSPSPCIVNPSAVCYRVILYTSTIELPKEAKGYTAIFQRCCRIDGIQNLNPSSSLGASYTCEIHGYENLAPGEVNSNPQFYVKDTVLICQNRRFVLDFGASDADGDSLSYEFCAAYSGGSSSSPTVTLPPPPSDLSVLSYAGALSGAQPLGPNVTIDPLSGKISGIAPTGGDYVVCVCLSEWRRGKILSTHRKDFILRVDANCDFAAAELKPRYISCDGFDFSFHNEAPFSTLIHTYHWDFGVPGRIDDTSSLAKPTFVFPDTGVYKVTLVINPGESCSESATTLVSVYPGFFPGFVANGSCRFNPFLFNDTTRTNYGIVSKWNWNFGDETTMADTSNLKSPSWKYSSTGYKTVVLTVESSNGCLKSVVYDSVNVTDKPTVMLPFRDTLICTIDTLQLKANGSGTFSWQPNTFIMNANTATPMVFPKTTTTYQVTVSDNGCVNSDSVRVKVVSAVSLDAGPDISICLSDSVTLQPNSNGLTYSWTPAATLNNAKSKRPVAKPVTTTTYRVVATIGKCSSTDDVIVRTFPYPAANAGNDITICYNDTVQLHGLITGSSFNWTPAGTILNASSLNPVVHPSQTTFYILMVRDTLGCNKPKSDTVMVTVQDKVIAFAGRDTTVVIGQPLQLSGSGGEFYLWSPSSGLNKSDVQAPVATLNDNTTYYMKAFTASGCFNYDTINIKVFKTQPDIFVPTAFTPGKGSNNRFRPIPAGISNIEFFQVYNRWGQMVFSSNNASVGWDGTYGGKDQEPGTYVWMVRGKDYTGKVIFKKGTMVLLR